MHDGRGGIPRGRREAVAALDRLRLDGGVRVLRGEGGSGRTMLLDWFAASLADGGVVVVVRPVAAEAAVELAAAADLAGRLERSGLPEPMHDALEELLLLRPSPHPIDIRVLGSSLVAAITASAPIAILLDDAVHLDRASAAVLGYALRRLGTGAIALVVDGGEPTSPFAGIEAIGLGPLTDDDLRAVVLGAVPDAPGAQVDAALAGAGGRPGPAIDIARAPVASGAELDPTPAALLLERCLTALGEGDRTAAAVGARAAASKVHELDAAAAGMLSRALAAVGDRAAADGALLVAGTQERDLLEATVVWPAPAAPRVPDGGSAGGTWTGLGSLHPALLAASDAIVGDDLEAARRCLDELAATGFGIDPAARWRAGLVRARLALATGHWVDAAVAADDAEGAAQWLWGHALGWAQVVGAEVAALRGETRLAEGWARSAAADGADAALHVAVEDVLAFVALTRGRADDALQHFALADAARHDPAASHWRAHDADRVEALLGLGRAEEAAAIVEQMELRSLVGGPSAAAAVFRCRALLAGVAGDPVSVELAEAAVAALERTDRPFETGRALLTLGQVQRRARDRGAAKASLEAALAVFEQVGAPAFSARTGQELGRIGSRGPSGSVALTETECRVVEAVVGGATVKSAAAALFLSPKTVEANLTRIYRKLGLSTRAELGAWWAAQT